MLEKECGENPEQSELCKMILPKNSQCEMEIVVLQDVLFGKQSGKKETSPGDPVFAILCWVQKMQKSCDEKNYEELIGFWQEFHFILKKIVLNATQNPGQNQANVFRYGQNGDFETLEKNLNSLEFEMDPQKIALGAGSNFLWQRNGDEKKMVSECIKQKLAPFFREFLENFYTLREKFENWKKEWEDEKWKLGETQPNE
ncbi:hypothetical protein HN954_00920 [bacterium]|jgi:hypothetical protein|nr:hypothetical protein [bacterium]MBT6831885.1 hypothetical protein [bacterium]MBT6995975.1 hypothetical protein [bacterium]MBT7772250.1 hypothetical protein [bacterium]